MKNSLKEELIEVDCKDITTSPFQPRRHFSDQELQELADSIRLIGIIHPPVVRKTIDEDRTKYELVAGERRWRAAQLAGLERITVLVCEGTFEMAASATLIENIQRVDLDPIEMAHAFKRLMDFFGMTQEELAKKIGKKRSTIANYLRLLFLPKSIQEDLSSAKISMGHAKVILSLPHLEAQRALHLAIIEKNLTVRQAEEMCAKLSKKKSSPSQQKKTDIYCKDIEERLQEYFGTKAKLSSKGSQGQIMIEYYNLDDLDRILEKILKT